MHKPKHGEAEHDERIAEANAFARDAADDAALFVDLFRVLGEANELLDALRSRPSLDAGSTVLDEAHRQLATVMGRVAHVWGPLAMVVGHRLENIREPEKVRETAYEAARLYALGRLGVDAQQQRVLMREQPSQTRAVAERWRDNQRRAENYADTLVDRADEATAAIADHVRHASTDVPEDTRDTIVASLAGAVRARLDGVRPREVRKRTP